MKVILKSRWLLGALAGVAIITTAVFLVYFVNKPSVPTPSSRPSPRPSPTSAAIMEVGGGVCSLSFTVEEEVTPPECNDVCDEVELICPTGLSCIIETGETEGVCRLPNYPEEEDCLPPASTNPSPSPSLSPSPSPSPSSTSQASLDCVVKRVYEDDARNNAGTYYLNSEIVDTNMLQNNQVIVYNVVVANHGELAVSDTKITDVLSSNLTYMDASSGCSYGSANRTVTCTIGALDGNTETSKSIRVKVAVAGTSAINNRAEVFSTNGQRDSCEIAISATGTITQEPSPVPSSLPEAGVFEVTTGTLSLGLVLLLLGGLGLLIL